MRVFSASLHGSTWSFLRVGIVLLEDKSEVVEASERHDNRIHNRVEIVDVHRSNAALIAAAAKSKQLEEDTLLILLAIK